MSEPDFSNKEEAFEVLRKWHDEIRATLQKEFDAHTAEAVAAAREEQREADAKFCPNCLGVGFVERPVPCPYCDDSTHDHYCPTGTQRQQCGCGAERIRATPLTATPLADRIAELERQREGMLMGGVTTEARQQMERAENAEAERDAARADAKARVEDWNNERTLVVMERRRANDLEAERDALRAQVEAVWALCADFDRGGGLMWPGDVLAAMDGAKP